MSEYIISIALKSNCLLGSGEGWGSVIDADIVFDSFGLPYFPARRLKGCLRESANEVLEMLEDANINEFDEKIVAQVFGSGSKSAGIIFNNLYLPNYREVASWCQWIIEQFNDILSPEIVVNSYTTLRQQTAVNEKGIADDGSLRTYRVLKPDITFEGSIDLKEENKEILSLLALSCANLRRVGTLRNRGYGKIKCTLKKGKTDLSKESIKQLEEGVV